MTDPAITLIDKRVDELIQEANRILAPYNAAIAELQKLRNLLEPPKTVEEALPPATEGEPETFPASNVGGTKLNLRTTRDTDDPQPQPEQ